MPPRAVKWNESLESPLRAADFLHLYISGFTEREGYSWTVNSTGLFLKNKQTNKTLLSQMEKIFSSLLFGSSECGLKICPDI